MHVFLVYEVIRVLCFIVCCEASIISQENILPTTIGYG